MNNQFALDQKSGPSQTGLALDQISDEEPVRVRAFRAVALWLGMAVLGMVLALLWAQHQRSTLI
jgi:hypothetical protein